MGARAAWGGGIPRLWQQRQRLQRPGDGVCGKRRYFGELVDACFEVSLRGGREGGFGLSNVLDVLDSDNVF